MIIIIALFFFAPTRGRGVRKAPVLSSTIKSSNHFAVHLAYISRSELLWRQHVPRATNIARGGVGGQNLKVPDNP